MRQQYHHAVALRSRCVSWVPIENSDCAGGSAACTCGRKESSRAGTRPPDAKARAPKCHDLDS
jgi:hypothetical protein